MAISLKTAGTWAEYTTDLQTVTIPGTPAAGDRMYLFVHWKDFAITLAQPSGWTTLVNSYADGSVSTGNGTGSISQAIFYRDWQSGDGNPQLDFSTTTNLLAEAVVMLWTKGGGDTWGVPSYVTSAWPSGAGPATENADTTANVGDGAAVMLSIGIRDDSATFTRSTTDIADSGGLITWNGNYTESPATHYTTTTGNDHSGDLGHRLVTTGANGVTLQGKISALTAAETGSMVWAIQGLATTQTLTPSAQAIPIGIPVPTVDKILALTPSAQTIPIGIPAPTLVLTKDLSPSPIAIQISVPAPTVIVDQTIAPAPITIQVALPGPTLDKILALSPSPQPIVISIPSPTIEQPGGGDTTLTPGPVQIVISVPAPTISTPLSLSPTPITIPIAIPSPTIEIVGGGNTYESCLALAGSNQFLIDCVNYYQAYYAAGTELERAALQYRFLLAHGGRVIRRNGQRMVAGGMYPVEWCPFS